MSEAPEILGEEAEGADSQHAGLRTQVTQRRPLRPQVKMRLIILDYKDQCTTLEIVGTKR